MSKKPYSIITGKDLTLIREEDMEPIIENILYRGDYVFISAHKKTGKSILAQHMTCNLSTGKDFLDFFKVGKPSVVYYMPTEVKLWMIKQRFQKIGNAVGINNNNIYMIPTEFKYNTSSGHNSMNNIFDEINRPPDVVIIDALYKAIKGSLKEDDVINSFHDAVDNIMRRFPECAVVVIHHLKKPSKDKEGKEFKSDDNDTFGSSFIGNGVEHMFRLEKSTQSKGELVLLCETQRSGLIMDDIRLEMVCGEDKLYYKMKSKYFDEKMRTLKALIEYDSLSIDQIASIIDCCVTKAKAVVKKLLNDGKIDFIKGKPYKYYIIDKSSKLVESYLGGAKEQPPETSDKELIN